MRRKRSILLAALLIVLAAFGIGTAVSPPGNTTASGPPLLHVSETEFDFGHVIQGATVSHVFWLKNAGGGTLHIETVKPACGCTKAPLKKHELAAGESTYVELIFSTKHYSSAVRKSARILCNAANDVPSLTIAAEVHPRMVPPDIFSADRYSIELDEDNSESGNVPQTREIILKNLSNADVTWTIVSRPNEYVDIAFAESAIAAPGNTQRLTLRFDEDIADAVFTKSLTVEASDADRTRLTIPLTKTKRWGPAQTSQR